jgi:Putative MetA-pathway of phenol degradation
MWALRTTAVAVGLILAIPSRSLAQIDYRNLDHERPVATEDAYPVERHAFELLVPLRSERDRAGDHLHLVPLEIEYGILDNAQIGVGLPLAVVDTNESDSEGGLAGLSAFGLYNFNTEGPVLPALSLAADMALPVGSLAGDHARFSLRAIATRSWGRTRVHFNAVQSFGSEDQPGVEFAPRWSYGLALDRTLFRSSLLVVGELLTQRAVKEAPTELNVAVGLRYQLTPTLVVDAGIARRLVSDAGPDYDLTVGLSHAFGFSWLLPGRGR